MDRILSVAKIVASTSVDGPGLRTSLYLQGCPIQCPGCHNEALWDINGGKSMLVGDVARELMETDENISILGGEPLMQYESVIDLCTILNIRSGKSIWLWTGYDWDYVKEHFPKIGGAVDVVVTGPFVKEKMVRGQWFGSLNQQIIALSPRGKEECKKI